MSGAREHGILFKPMMVDAIRDSRKSMTRRIAKPQPIVDEESGYVFAGAKQLYKNDLSQYPDWKQRFCDDFCPYVVEDVLFVRETHFSYGRWVKDGKTKGGAQKWKFTPLNNDIRYTDSRPSKFLVSRNKKYPDAPCWYKRNSLFMPKSAARIWLRVTGVRLERLQDISEQDAIKEGIESGYFKKAGVTWYLDYTSDHSTHLAQNAFEDPRKSFQSLWVSINGKVSWDYNQWLYVVSFEEILGYTY